LDVPLPQIAEALAGAEEAVLATQLERVEAEIDRRRRTARALTRLIEEGLLRQEVTLVQEPARRLVVRRTTSSYDQIGAAVGSCIASLMAEVPPGWTPPIWGMYPLDIADEMAIAVGVASTAPGESEWLPAGPTATTTHVGSYEDITLAYQGLFAWIYERGLRPTGPAREGYLAGPDTSAPDQLVTRLVIPLEEPR
jgi:hypothetical protein